MISDLESTTKNILNKKIERYFKNLIKVHTQKTQQKWLQIFKTELLWCVYKIRRHSANKFST